MPSQPLSMEQKLEEFDYLYDALVEYQPMLDAYKEVIGFDFEGNREYYKQLLKDTKHYYEFYVIKEKYIMSNTKTKKKITKIIIAIAIVVLSIVAFLLVAPWAYIAWRVISARVEVDDDISNYNNYFGEYALEDYNDKNGIDDSIFPAEITSNMDVQEFKMVYYNPWDAQYLSYLVVQYDEAAFEEEVTRLKECGLDSYQYQQDGVSYGYYGVTGFPEEYELLGLVVSSYHGYVYAMADDNNTIIYVLLDFCNYHYDMDYEKYIDEKYLPVGFDASEGNAYQEMKQTWR